MKQKMLDRLVRLQSECCYNSDLMVRFEPKGDKKGLYLEVAIENALNAEVLGIVIDILKKERPDV
jgi:hypothetical protein